ncbi:undecaprenyldiphospho-muramoylpentapeptide beta-N-acetylglucosaminyltransferase [Candidatus Cardinium hertigii]|uniref:UDP-N-acetylglucosamine--N-acetylmuramyl-(pentapeptide) pyrophosphoryl-undecaprenol N-acetylglucosamine transferase n=1 Tax=Candidatus Cardinium hertigii TaxID=247481 RepID=A0A3N2QBD2_9BACT|nr:undecaprenyldiphospho-muramoylpentapeptide beta-N-acetylglucosaminyltransferase [Candidatus Cardinium hertigii]ROT46949.1 undecaprenyldiphospho-muramoylpentapeptide beta-N-acetylglucosaminyltransferase [Candidatus Cardinium hertigii]
MRLLIGCGGTGGHIYPAISIAHALKEQFADVELLFVGAKGGMEMDIVPAAGYPIAMIDIKGLQRKKNIQNIWLPFLVLKSFYQARKIIKLFKPDVVIGTGGYACFPTLFAAYSQKIPTLIHEQNGSAGLANRLLSRLVTKICTGYPAVVFPCAQEKIIFTGNPVRPSMYMYMPKKEQAEALRYFNLSPSKKCLLVVGGSGGASQLNTTILSGIDKLHALHIQLLWITGDRYFASMDGAISSHNRDNFIRCYPFLTHMEMAYAAADVVIARAGAISIAELCVTQKPTILVPSPNVVGDHQTKNSLPLANQGAAILLTDQDCPRLLLPTAIALLNNIEQQLALVKQMHTFALLHANALNRIIEEIFTLAKCNRNDCISQKNL